MQQEDQIFRNFIKNFQVTPQAQMEAKYAKVNEKTSPKKSNFGEMKLKDTDIKIKEDADIDWEHDSDLDAEAELGL